MTHDEAGLAAYLEGALDGVEAAAWDEHLLGCRECWAALEQARRGQRLAASLREEPPAELRRRVEVAVAGAGGGRPPRCRRALVAAIAAAATAVVAAVTLLVAAAPSGGIHDPQPIAAVLRLAADRTAEVPPEEGPVRITRLHVGGRDVVLARSADPFPMPEAAIALSDDARSPWLARRGEVSLLCFSDPSPILLAGQASPETLTEVATALGIPVPGRNQTAAPGVPPG